MMRQLMTTVALTALVCPAFAGAIVDPRIRVEPYDFNRVVPIYTAVGEPTLIQFEQDERIVDTPEGMLGMGDAKAWSVGPKGSNIMLKPKAQKPDTTLLVVTTKRTYAFQIITVTPKTGEPVTNILRFTYPDTQHKLAERKAQIALEAKERSEKVEAAIKAAALVEYRNHNYMKQGDDALAPSAIEDDGRFTYMHFNSSRPMPVVYKVLPSGAEEAMTNFHMEPKTATLVIHEVAPKFVLRYGESVLAIRNDGYNPDGKINVLGTTVPGAVRLIKDQP